MKRDQNLQFRTSTPASAGTLREGATVIEEPVRVFVRQPFTESGNAEKEVIQGVLDVLSSLNADILTGAEAQSEGSFRAAFEARSGLPFTPSNFRGMRLRLLDSSDAMILIRTSLSESGAFEAAYNVFGGPQVPMFFAVWKNAPIKTTLLRDMDELCPAEYVTFDQPEELRDRLAAFLRRSRQGHNRAIAA